VINFRFGEQTSFGKYWWLMHIIVRFDPVSFSCHNVLSYIILLDSALPWPRNRLSYLISTIFQSRMGLRTDSPEKALQVARDFLSQIKLSLKPSIFLHKGSDKPTEKSSCNRRIWIFEWNLLRFDSLPISDGIMPDSATSNKVSGETKYNISSLSILYALEAKNCHGDIVDFP